jgi:hypothetical protein
VQASVVWESHRLASYVDSCQAAVARVQYSYDPLRMRLSKAGLPWDEALLTDLRWASQRAGAALMRHALDAMEDMVRWAETKETTGWAGRFGWWWGGGPEGHCGTRVRHVGL